MTATPPTPALETRQLTKVYGEGNTRVVAMQDVTVRVERGEVVALLGPSGSGKSTFLTAVGLINPPTSGSVWIGGASRRASRARWTRTRPQTAPRNTVHKGSTAVHVQNRLW